MLETMQVYVCMIEMQLLHVNGGRGKNSCFFNKQNLVIHILYFVSTVHYMHMYVCNVLVHHVNIVNRH